MGDIVASSWFHGLASSILASMIGAGSKLCIRRSYTLLMVNIDADKIASKNKQLLERNQNVNSEGSKREDSYNNEIHGEEEVELCPCIPHQYNQAQQQQHEWLNKLFAFSLRMIGFFGMSVLGPVCNVYALQFASPSILSPIGGGLTLVWVVLFSECTIGEKPRPIQVAAVAFIVIGEIIIAITGDHSNAYSKEFKKMEQEYIDPLFLSYFSCMILWIALLVYLINYENKKLRRFAWGMIGGSITGMQNFIKDALAVVHRVDNGSSGGKLFYSYPFQFYILILMAATVALTGLLLLMACMKRYDANFSASMYLGSTVISASIMSMVHYHTFDRIGSRIKSISYLMGLLTLLFGCTILANEERLGKIQNPHQRKNNTIVPRDEREYGTIEQ